MPSSSARSSVSPDPGDMPSGDKKPVSAEPSSLRERLWLFTEEPSSSPMAYVGSISVLIVIMISTFSFVLETVEQIQTPSAETLDLIEVLSVAVFTGEVTLRICTCPDIKKYLSEFFNIVDILAILPFYVGLDPKMHSTNTSSFGVIRAVRLVRVARVFKVSRYSVSIRIFVQAILLSLNSLITLVYLVCIAMVIFSSGVFYAESVVGDCREYRDYSSGLPCVLSEENKLICLCEKPNPYSSIPATFWWCIVTMTTVGYGDMVPITPAGQLLAALAMITGMIVLALPISVIGTNFTLVYNEVMEEQEAQMRKEEEDSRIKEESLLPGVEPNSQLQESGPAMKEASHLQQPFEQVTAGARPVVSSAEALSGLERLLDRRFRDLEGKLLQKLSALESLMAEEKMGLSSSGPLNLGGPPI